VATNYDEDDHSDNDGSALCRYEFYEIIVRMAREKFYSGDKEKRKITNSVAEALQKLLDEFIIPNSPEHMPWQEFRDD
jgi:hypothetical protein